MKNINKILATVAIPFVLVGCSKVDGKFRDTAKNKQERVYSAYETTVKGGDNLSFYLAKEGYPISLDAYTSKVQELNKNNLAAFVNYDGGQIRTGKKIILPDLNGDGKVAGRVCKKYS